MPRSLGLIATAGGAIRFSGSALVDLGALERAYVDFVIHRCGGNVSRAARALGLDRRTLQRKRARWSGDALDEATADDRLDDRLGGDAFGDDHHRARRPGAGPFADDRRAPAQVGHRP